MPILRRVLPVVLLLAVGVALGLGVLRSKPLEGLYSGVVETTTYDLAFEVSGRLEAFGVEEGQSVAAGTAVARLRESDLEAALQAAKAREGVAVANLAALEAGSRPEEIAQAEARTRRAQAQLDQLRNGPTHEEVNQAREARDAARQAWQIREKGFRAEDVEAARASVEAARSTLERARTDAERYRRLHQEDAVPLRTLEEFENRLVVATSQHDAAVQAWEKLKRGYTYEEREQARHEYEVREARFQEVARGARIELVQAAEAELASARATLALVREGPRAEDRQAARRRLEEARAAVRTATLNLRKARLLAPTAGLVVTRNFEVGEMVQPGVPVVTMEDLTAPWVEVFVPETEIGKVRVGDRFSVTVDSMPGRTWEGKVTRVYEKAEFTPKTIQTQRERVNLVFRVKVTVENPDGVLKPGMPADARLLGPGPAPQAASPPATPGPSPQAASPPAAPEASPGG